MNSLISRGPVGVDVKSPHDVRNQLNDRGGRQQAFPSDQVAAHTQAFSSKSVNVNRSSLADTGGVNTTGWDVLAKVHLGQQFFKTRALRVPTEALPIKSFSVSEQTLRRLILALIFLFLVCLGGGTTANLMVNRTTTINEQGRMSSLYADLAARNLETRLAGTISDGGIPRIPSDTDLAASLPENSTTAGRLYFVTDHAGYIRATSPDGQRFAGLLLSDVAQPGNAELLNTQRIDMKKVTLPDGERAYIFVRALSDHPSTLALVQVKSLLLADWSRNLITHISLIITTALVLTLIGAAFHWQSARAVTADETLALATSRLDTALARGHCGLWDWNIARGHIFWSRSMFDILGIAPRAELLSYGEVVELLHPEDRNFDTLVDTMLKEGQVVLDREFRMRHSDGHWVWLRARAELAEAPGEEAPHLVGIAIDITEQKRTDQLNQQADMRLRDAIENISEAFVLWDKTIAWWSATASTSSFTIWRPSVVRPGAAYDDVIKAAKEPLVRTRIDVNEQ